MKAALESGWAVLRRPCMEGQRAQHRESPVRTRCAQSGLPVRHLALATLHEMRTSPRTSCLPADSVISSRWGRTIDDRYPRIARAGAAGLLMIFGVSGRLN